MSLVFDRPQLFDKLTGILEKQSEISNDLFKNKIIPFDTSKFPLALNEYYNNYKEFSLEIGSGWGEFTLANAQKNSEVLTIALEKKKPRILRSVKNQIKKEIENVRWMIIDISWYFEGIFSAEQFDSIIINFPDPWPKAKHHKHRFLKPDMVAELSKISKPGALLQYGTDYWPYMESGLTLLENSGYWENTFSPLTVRRSIPDRPVSFFQRIKKEEGENVYFACLKRSNKKHMADDVPATPLS
ncbi:MAG: hypothetical protein ABUK01_14285 [Leptospirales bacterium]